MVLGFKENLLKKRHKTESSFWQHFAVLLRSPQWMSKHLQFSIKTVSSVTIAGSSFN